MKKVTKKGLNERLLLVEALLGLHRELPEQVSIDKANDAIFRMQWAVSRGKELAEAEPKLKQLDQSVFDGESDDKRFFAIDADGEGWFFKDRPSVVSFDERWVEPNHTPTRAGFDYDASDWQNSLIERDKVELTGSDLTEAMLARGDVCVPCEAYDGTEDWKKNSAMSLVTKFEAGMFHCAAGYDWENAVPINTVTGEPLTQSDVGL